jgi:hypothetical protein
VDDPGIIFSDDGLFQVIIWRDDHWYFQGQALKQFGRQAAFRTFIILIWEQAEICPCRFL